MIHSLPILLKLITVTALIQTRRMEKVQPGAFYHIRQGSS